MKTENVAVRGIVHRFYQGVLYCQIAIHFHGTNINVVPFTLIRKV